MPHLGVVVVSVREGRVGRAVADWFFEAAGRHGGFEPTLIDLKAIDLPILNEPNHPRFGKYTQTKTKEWSALAASMDTFVFVSPEYNFSSPPALVNAIDHLYAEWNYKAAAFVSYGGVSGGLRAVQMSKQLLTTVKMVPIVEAVAIPFITQFIDKTTGAFQPSDAHEKSATVLLDELARWDHALSTLRAGQ